MTLRAKPMRLKTANALIDDWHRHHEPVIGHRFSIAVVDEFGTVHGAVVVGRPVSRELDPEEIAEVSRLVTDGTKNACSLLYAAAARACRAMGFLKIQTYILDTEPGTSLRAAGWKFEGMTATKSRQWTGTNGKPRRSDQPTQPKQRWSRTLNRR